MCCKIHEGSLGSLPSASSEGEEPVAPRRDAPTSRQHCGLCALAEGVFWVVPSALKYLVHRMNSSLPFLS